MQFVGDRTSVGRGGFSLKWSVQEELEVVEGPSGTASLPSQGRGKAAYIVHTTLPRLHLWDYFGSTSANFVSVVSYG
ncbi:hypothetical protein H5410_029481 [Solanum commersonii]|uniref:Uncharacterized protein n=1 Tax=Solanum commersonii TaxID=4109 RepID=A0A9J5Z6X5_SOLCO|nr:hypothetical protein H5410_029481 [Solanum commersonii]